MRYDTVVWDLDGTLFDTLSDLTASANAALRVLGHPERTVDEIRRMVGNGAARLMREALPDGAKDELDEALALFLSHYGVHYADASRPYPGIPGALARLRGRGVAMAVVSNKPDRMVKAICSAYFPIPVAIGDRAGMRRKPAPDGVALALARLGKDASRAVYIGDSEVDIATAQNAGLPCISVGWGFRAPEALRTAGADRIVPDVPALLALLFQEGEL